MALKDKIKAQERFNAIKFKNAQACLGSENFTYVTIVRGVAVYIGIGKRAAMWVH